MIGGHGCGKTSALSCMFEQAINSPIDQYFTVLNQTHIDNGMDSLLDKSHELKRLLYNSSSSSFLIDIVGGHCINRHSFSIREPGSSKSISLEIFDLPGSLFNSCHHAPTINDEVKKCDVIIICIDTPYLMGPVEEEYKELCSESVNFAINRVQDINNHLATIADKEKMVIFVPLKSEKWSKEGRLSEVSKRIKIVYNNAIKAFLHCGKTSVCIIPVETVGNIIFSEFKAPYVIQKNEKFTFPKRCCMISDSVVRLEDGKPYKLKDCDYIYQDASANINIFGTNMLKPYAWYHVNNEDSSYSPKNGEQLLIHILKFYVNKRRKNRNKFIRYFYPPEDITWLENLISQLNANGLIINNNDGIEYFKNYN